MSRRFHAALVAIRVLQIGGRPSAIFRTVGTIVVDAIKRVTVWTGAHVGSERRVVVSPSCAHGNATAAVALIAAVLWIAAPLNHRGPRGVDATAPGLVMAIVAVRAPAFDAKAPATVRVAAAKVPATDDALLATVAPAHPHRLTTRAQYAMQNAEPSELLSGDVEKRSSHTLLSHADRIYTKAVR